jgi:hypothetical protein
MSSPAKVASMSVDAAEGDSNVRQAYEKNLVKSAAINLCVRIEESMTKQRAAALVTVSPSSACGPKKRPRDVTPPASPPRDLGPALSQVCQVVQGARWRPRRAA